MIKRSRFSLITLAIALAGLTACDSGEPVAGPSLSVDGAYLWNAVVVPTTSPQAEATYTAVIGRQGGVVRAGDHMLLVPSKAVESATEFTVKVMAGNKIGVDLSATRVSDGATVSQFPVPLTIRLSYKHAAIRDPYRMKIAYVLDGQMAGARQVLTTTISQLTQTLSATTNHFSPYDIIQD